MIPLASAALFVRLGFWQLDRHRERAVVTQALADRLLEAPVSFDEARTRSTDPDWTRVSAEGVFRYDLEQVLAGRTSDGSPGVHLVTPLALPGTDTLVIVIRGWVYSPDAAGADLARWREADAVRLTGYLMPLPDEGAAPPPDRARPLRSLNRAALAQRVGAPLFPLQLVMTSDSLARIDSIPKRLPPPEPAVGPHRSYAIQWFSFAVIALIGGIALFRRGIVGDRANR